MASDNEMRIIFGADTTPLRTEVAKATATVDKFADSVEQASGEAAKGFDQLRKSVKGIPEAFDKVAGGSVVLNRIAGNLDASGKAAVESAKAFKVLEGAPLQTLDKLDAAIAQIRLSLANGFKANLDTSGLSPQAFENLAGEVDAVRASLVQLGNTAAQGSFDKATSEADSLITALKNLAATSAQTNAAAQTLQTTFNQGFDEGITEELRRAGVSIEAFKAALAKLSVGGLNLSPLTQSLDQIEDEAAKTKVSLETLGQAPIDDLKALDSQLRIIRETLSSKLSANLDTSNISGATFAKAADDVDKLRAAIGQLGLSSTNTTATAKNLTTAFQQGFAQGVIEELHKAGVSVDEFKNALQSLTGVGGANLAPLIQVLDSIQAESTGTTTAIKNIGSALQGVSVLAKAPINDLEALDAELKVIKATLASGFKPSIEKINLEPGDFQGVQNAINSANDSVEHFGQTVRKTINDSVQSVDGLKDAAATIPAAFEKAERSATGLSKIGQSIESAGDAAAKGAKAFKQFGRLPLDDLKNFDKQLRTIRNTLASGFKPAVDAIKLIPANFSKATQAVNQFGNAAKKVKGEAGAASLALTDVSRVVQDLPFGFLGIANNINPMVESFARLKKETGSTGGALKALAGSLTGAGGLGLAIGVVTAAFTIYQNGILGFNRKTKDAQDAFEEFKESLRDSAAITADATGSVQGEIVRVQALAAIVGDLNKSTGERKRALTELQGINKSYFGDLTLEAAALGKVKTATDEYTNALIAQAVVKGFSDEISKMSTELFKQEGILKKLAADYVRVNNEIEKVKSDKALGPGAPAAAALAGGVENASEALNKQIAIVGDLRNKFSDLKGEMGKAVLAANQFKSLDLDKSSIGGGGEDKKLKALKDQLEGFRKELEVVNKLREEGILPKFREDDAEQLSKKILETLNAIDKREVELKIKPKLEIDPQLNEFEVDKIEAEANKKLAFTKMQAPLSLVIDEKGVISQVQAAANEALKRAGIKAAISPAEEIGAGFIDIQAIEESVKGLQAAGVNAGEAFRSGFKSTYPGFAKDFNENFVKALNFQAAFEKIQQDFKTNVMAAIEQATVNMFIGIGESLGKALTGEKFNPLKAVLSSIADMLGTIGKIAIETGVGMLLLKKALKSSFSNPAALIAAGVGLVALSEFAKTKINSSVPKFADGGLVLGPTLAMVGEAGPEMVVPLNRANNFLDTGSSSKVQVEGVIRGQDIFLSQSRFLNSNSRKA